MIRKNRSHFQESNPYQRSIISSWGSVIRLLFRGVLWVQSSAENLSSHQQQPPLTVFLWFSFFSASRSKMDFFPSHSNHSWKWWGSKDLTSSWPRATAGSVWSYVSHFWLFSPLASSLGAASRSSELCLSVSLQLPHCQLSPRESSHRDTVSQLASSTDLGERHLRILAIKY